jgi:MoxR-like ATPase
MRFEGPQDVVTALREVDYLADDRIAQVVFLAGRLDKPVLVEGPAGVGKTELAKAMAAVTGRELIRLQCYEGLDEAKALYEWNYKKQLLRIQSDVDHDWDSISHDIFSEEFLLTRPLLEAIRSTEPVVLLIDEVDRVEVERRSVAGNCGCQIRFCCSTPTQQNMTSSSSRTLGPPASAPVCHCSVNLSTKW